MHVRRCRKSEKKTMQSKSNQREAHLKGSRTARSHSHQPLQKVQRTFSLSLSKLLWSCWADSKIARARTRIRTHARTHALAHTNHSSAQRKRKNNVRTAQNETHCTRKLNVRVRLSVRFTLIKNNQHTSNHMLTRFFRGLRINNAQGKKYRQIRWTCVCASVRTCVANKNNRRDNVAMDSA